MRRARLRTTHADPETVAAAIRPDNTDSMRTSVTGDAVETVIERETTGGLQSTVDDYVVNLAVAESVTTAVRDGDARRTHTTDNDQS